MTPTQQRHLHLLAAWFERWDHDSNTAAARLSQYRKVTPGQVRKMLNREICPNPETFAAWAAEINSTPQRRNAPSIMDFFGGIFR